MKYIFVPFFIFDSAGVAPAIDPAALRSRGDAMAAEPATMNFLLVNFEFVSVITFSPSGGLYSL
jgi:hypothetical protein